ncbi:AAA family ATPase [Oceanitalea stevensii]|uniref:UvrABC system protein A n=1 Tax=Oceanitalea stevensii TaxID=2763072 RepID=A0ABR8YY89_9MICO|nr:AAA family ATPase [Oceanitalea stevensii]MBD8061042.1 AAA family ATPase [Oceanitalea stevensii]
MTSQPDHISVRGARVHNLKDVDVDIPLRELVAIAGVSGSGKSSLALGVLYAEGSRRYVEALSTYTRRRMAHAPRAAVDSVEHVPAALALRQRPGVPGVRSTFGTSTELLNVIRLMFSRLASHVCPNGHRVPPTIDVAAEVPFTCQECGANVQAPGAEQLAFNSEGACPTCTGTGVVRDVDDAALVPDESKTIDDGAVVPWQMFNFKVQPAIIREFGVRTDVPFRDLAAWEREIVFNGPEEKKHITFATKKNVHDLNFTFRNARLTVTEELKRATDEKRLRRVARFLTEGTCRTCDGTRLSERARLPRIGELGLADVTAMTLDDVVAWAPTVTATLPRNMHEMSEGLVETLQRMARRLVELGLGYLTLDRAGATLSTGERQRVQLARAVRNRTTGVLYVLDEPSIGLHPSNVDGLIGVMRDLLADGNSVVFVDHDVQILREASWLVEIGPGSGTGGGRVIAQGTAADLAGSPDSLLSGFLTGEEPVVVRDRAEEAEMFDAGRLRLATDAIHTVHPLEVDVPRGRLVAVTGVSGSGKTTLVLESLVPALLALADDDDGAPRLPRHVRSVEAEGIKRVHTVDATPIGINVRSTVATYSGVYDDLRKAYAATEEAKRRGLTASDFSYNTGSLACPRCEGTGQVTLDVQFLPDVDVPCPDCNGSRYAPEASEIRRDGLALPELLGFTVDEVIDAVGDIAKVRRRLQALADLGLGYLTLGEDTPALSGGEAQRLKLATQLHRDQSDAVFVLDEPSVGLHPLDVRTLLRVLQRLADRGATVIVIEHDLDLIANADYVIDMGPGGGEAGGQIVAVGTPDQIAEDAHSVTGQFLSAHLPTARR